jgi:hypothetical protein
MRVIFTPELTMNGVLKIKSFEILAAKFTPTILRMVFYIVYFIISIYKTKHNHESNRAAKIRCFNR